MPRGSTWTEIGKIVGLEGGLHVDQGSVGLDQEPDHLVGGAIGDIEKLIGRIAGKRIRSYADGIRADQK